MTQSINHPANTHYVQLRHDFVELCKRCDYKKETKDGKKSRSSPHCKALILSILECFAPCKKEGEPVTMTVGQWKDRMYGLYGRNAILDSLDELVGEKFITRRAFKSATAEVYGYWLHYAVINERLASIPEGMFQMKPTSIGIVSNETNVLTCDAGIVPNETGVVSNETGGSSHLKHIVTTSNVTTNITPEEESVIASASHIPPLDSSSQETESEETNEAEPTTPSQVSPIATGKPAPAQDERQNVQPAAKKPRARSKKQASTEPLAPPARPDPAVPWTVEKCLAWGDYFRGFAYPHSERSNSKSYQEREAARAILGRGKTEEKFIKLMCYMRGVTIDRDPVTDPIERSDWWPEHQPADIKHAHENWDKMSAEYRGKKAPMKPAVPSPSAPVPSTRNGVVAPLWQGADAAIHEAKAARQAVLDEMAQKQKMSVGA